VTVALEPLLSRYARVLLWGGLALALAIQVAAVDGIIRTSERELIFDTADALGIDGDTAADMVRDLTRK